jgi:CheY-like chemotaxis protein
MLDESALATYVPADAAADEIRWAFPPRRVLIVDDGPENRELLKLVLGETGLLIEEAENGQIAVDIAGRMPVDLILMDMQMPVMDGYTATRTLRDRGLTIPIFALSANAMKGAEQDILAAGCSGCLMKPVNIDELMGTLAALLGGTRVEAAKEGVPQVDMVTPPATMPPPVAAPVATLGAPAAVVVSRGPPVVSRLARSVRLRPAIRKFGARLDEQIRAFDAAFLAENFEELAQLGHWLKGAAGTVGYDDFTEPAARLEQAAKDANAPELGLALAEVHDLAIRLEVPPEEPTTVASA